MKFQWVEIERKTMPIDGSKFFENGLGNFWFKGGKYTSSTFEKKLYDRGLTKIGVYVYSSGRSYQDNFIPEGVEFFPLVLTSFTNTYYFIGSDKEMILKEIFNVFKYHKIPVGVFFGKGGETIKLISRWLGRRIDFESEFSD